MHDALFIINKKHNTWCIVVVGAGPKGHKKGHKWPFLWCVNLKKEPPAKLCAQHNTLHVLYVYVLFVVVDCMCMYVKHIHAY